MRRVAARSGEGDDVNTPDYPPIVHGGDPETAREGAEEVTRSGRRASQMERCLDTVRGSPGLIASEIGAATGLGHVPAQRRLSDLKAQGLICMGPSRKWNGRPQVTWWPVIVQPRLL